MIPAVCFLSESSVLAIHEYKLDVPKADVFKRRVSSSGDVIV